MKKMLCLVQKEHRFLAVFFSDAREFLLEEVL